MPRGAVPNGVLIDQTGCRQLGSVVDGSDGDGARTPIAGINYGRFDE